MTSSHEQTDFYKPVLVQDDEDGLRIEMHDEYGFAGFDPSTDRMTNICNAQGFDPFKTLEVMSTTVGYHNELIKEGYEDLQNHVNDDRSRFFKALHILFVPTFDMNEINSIHRFTPTTLTSED